MKTLVFPLVLVVAWLVLTGTALAQAPVVLSFSRSGELVCGKLVAGSTAAVEWASSLSGPWQTTAPGMASVPVASNGTVTVTLPVNGSSRRFYRVRGVPQAAPVVTTGSATAVTSTTATLNAAGNPRGSATTGWFRYSTLNPGTGSDAFGTRAPVSSFSDSMLGAGAAVVTYSQNLTGLLPGTTYYYSALAQNVEGLGVGGVSFFTTPPAAPTVNTGSATNRTGTTAMLTATTNPGGAAGMGWFRISTVSPGAANDSFGTRLPASGGTAIAAGNASVSFSFNATGLTPGATYYYAAIVSTPAGTVIGTLRSFTTPLPPVATTGGATSLAGTTATLNGSANPNGASTTAWFRYSSSNPGVCNDSFGIRVPASGGVAMGAGTSAQPYSQSLAGLTAGTTYYYCAIASSAEGTAFGPLQTFTTPAAPAVTTAAATAVTSSSATLNGAANPNRASTTGWFRYSLTSPGTANDAFGTRAPSSSVSDAALGSGSASVPWSHTITGLLPGTTYYYTALAGNAEGMAVGTVLSFTTLPAAPTVSTGSATNRTGTTVTLNASTNPGGGAATGWFRISTVSPGTANDTFGTRVPASGGSAIAAGTSSVAFSRNVTGLTPGTTYYYAAIVSNASGTAFGTVQTFTTPRSPTVTTDGATGITTGKATLHGTANPNGASTTAWFRYSATAPVSANDITGIRAPATGGSSVGTGSTGQALDQLISGLSGGTTYYYWSIASNAEGTSFGTVKTFTTP